MTALALDLDDRALTIARDGRLLSSEPSVLCRAAADAGPEPWVENTRVSVFVLGDEFTGTSIQAALDSIGTLNHPDAAGHRPVRIHAIGFPEGPGMSPYTSIRFAILMRLLCEQNNGSFLALQP